MSQDDINTPKPIPSNVVTEGGNVVTENGKPIIEGPMDPGTYRVVLTDRSGSPITTRDGTPLTLRDSTPWLRPDGTPWMRPDGTPWLKETENRASSPDDAIPTLPEGQVFLVDADGTYLRDADGAFLTEASAPLPLNPVVTESGDGIVDENGNRLVVGGLSFEEQNAAYQRELTSRLERLEAALSAYSAGLPPRNHNRPPELVEPDPISPADLTLIVNVALELKANALQGSPDPQQLEAKASTFRRVAQAIVVWIGHKTDTAVEAGIQWGVPLGLGLLATNVHEVQAALTAVAEVASAWAIHLTAFGG